MRYFPVFFDLDGRCVHIAGGGAAAANKLRLFTKTGARLRCAALSFNEEISALIAAGRVEPVEDDPASAAFGDAALVIAATGTEADAVIAERAKQARVPVNVVDKPALCTFIMPSIVDRGAVVAAIGTGGTAPVLARRLRERIEAALPENLGVLAQLIGENRTRVSAVLPDMQERRGFWESAVDGEPGALALAGDLEGARAALSGKLAKHREKPAVEAAPKVTIVISPSSPGDLTLRALRELQDADKVLYASAAPVAVIELSRREAELVRVTARIGADEPSAFCEALLAASGRIVCLLAPGTSENSARALSEALRQQGLRVQICPIVTPLSAKSAIDSN